MASARLAVAMLAVAACALAAPAAAQPLPDRMPGPSFNDTPSRTLSLEDVAGCTGPNSGGALVPGLDASCRFEGLLSPKEL
jgi:hypothetical protein